MDLLLMTMCRVWMLFEEDRDCHLYWARYRSTQLSDPRSFTRLVPQNWMIVPKAKFRNYVMSEVLAQMEKDCERYCPVPRVPPRKVTIVGAGSDVGRVAALFLKQQPVVRKLSLYDDEPDSCVMGVANDLAHIDTSADVEAFQGRPRLGDALTNSDVVLICGGHFVTPPCCCALDRELFFKNMERVRVASIACSRFCPYAVVAVQTPPVDCNFALCMHTLKTAGVYDKRRVLGVNSISSMRANQLFCALTGADPAATHTPVICGTGRCTRVPVFSKGKAGNFPQTQVECLTKLVREADEIICKVKANYEQGHLSIGFSSARFVTSVMQGLFEKKTFIDSALVEQDQAGKCYGMEICATPLSIGKGGIVEYVVPTLNEVETKLLEESKCDLEDMLNLGRCYAVGDEYCLNPCKIYTFPPCVPCEICRPGEKSKINR